MTDERERTTGAADATDSTPSSSQHDLHRAPARITLLYESRDRRLCLFEDHDGHLTSVPAYRLV